MVNAVFHVGGAVQEGQLYVERPADQELPEALRRGEFCYVLAPRQIGKSSLALRTRKRLNSVGVRCVAVDLNEIGSHVTAEQWFYSLVLSVAVGLDLEEHVEGFWEAHARESLPARWARFCRTVVLEEVKAPVVIFLDEIDSILSVPSVADDFFASIRAMHEKREEDPVLARLSFCLLGAATPRELMKDEARTPFNIGRAIPLEDFTPAEAERLIPGLAGLGHAPRALLEAMLDWTDGHPYMTLKVANALVQEGPGTHGEVSAQERVEGWVRRLFLESGRQEEQNLHDAARRFSDEKRSEQIPKMLRLYRRLLAGERIAAVGSDPVQQEFRLTGMVTERREGVGRWLRVRNRIFATVFNEAWVREREADRIVAVPLHQWLDQGRSPDLLLRGALLERAQEWAGQRDDLTRDEQEFLEASRALAMQTRARRVLLGVLGSAVLVLLVMVGVLLGLNQEAQQAQARAEEARERAEQAELRSRETAEQLRQKNQEVEEALARAEEVRKKAERAEAETRESAAKLKVAVDQQRLKSQEALEAQQRAEEAQKRAEGEKERAEEEQKRAEQADARTREASISFMKATARLSMAVGQQRGGGRDAIEAAFATLVLAKKIQAPEPMEAFLGITRGVSDLKSVTTLAGHELEVESVEFSPDGDRLVTTSDDETARVWDSRSGKLVSTLKGHKARVNRAAFSLDGARVVTASEDKTARVWDSRTGKLVSTLKGHEGNVLSAAFSPDGTRVVTASEDKTARVWDSRTGKRVSTLKGHEGKVLSAAFSPKGGVVMTASDDKRGGALVVTTSDDRTARVWNSRTGELVSTLKGHEYGIVSATFSWGGFRVVTLDRDNTARVWDSLTGKLESTLEGPRRRVLSAVLSPDGRFVVMLGFDDTARVWDCYTGDLKSTLKGHEGRVLSAAFSPDGTRVVTASSDKTARLWIASPEGWIAEACNLPQFTPSTEELREFCRPYMGRTP